MTAPAPEPVERPAPTFDPQVTSAEALANAVRLLRAAEAETDRGLMERYEHLADSWTTVAAIQTQREHIAREDPL